MARQVFLIEMLQRMRYIIAMQKHIIQFQISKGDSHYIASGIDLPVVTQGKTLDELVSNLSEAVSLQLEGENLADFDLAQQPSVLANFEIPTFIHA
jgi:predicted RNase H-like HicB family nuclease